MEERQDFVAATLFSGPASSAMVRSASSAAETPRH